MIKPLFCIVLALTSTTVMAQGNATSTDLVAIEKLEQADAAAAKVNDVEALASLWTDDGVLIMPMTSPVSGKAAIHSLLEKQKQESAAVQTLSYEENWQERKVSGDQAFEWGTIVVKMKLPNDKEISQKAYLGRLLLRGPDGSWRFARVIGTPAPKSAP